MITSTDQRIGLNRDIVSRYAAVNKASPASDTATADALLLAVELRDGA